MSIDVKFLLKLLVRTALTAKGYERAQFYRNHRYWPILGRPRSLSEKICARKFDARIKTWVKYVDKVAARDFIAAQIGQGYLSHVFRVVGEGERVSLQECPDAFVLKGSHGSGSRYISFLPDRTQVGEEEINERIAEILKTGTTLFNRFDIFTNETFYRYITPKVMIEEYLRDCGNFVPPDYKFFVFHGKVHFVQLDMGRYVDHQRTLYDRNWVLQDVEYGYSRGDRQPPPTCLEEMVFVAEKIANALLADGISFARIDLFQIADKVKFGEITLTPGMGWERIFPREFDFQLGSLW